MSTKKNSTKKQLQEQLDKIKEIYEWDDDYNDDFIGSVKEREEIFIKYWGCPDIKEDYEKLQKENEELNKKKSIKWSRDFACPLIEKLKEENEKLHEEIYKRGHCEEVVENYEKGIMKRNKEIYELQKENGNLKEELSGYHQIKSKAILEEEEIVLGQHYPPGIIGMKNLVECWEYNLGYRKKYEELKEENEELKKQIPKKPRKCLSQKDKACLRRVRDVLGSFSDDDKASDDPTEDDWYDDETLKLLDRLLK